MLPQLPNHYMFLDEKVDMSEFTWGKMFKLIDSHPVEETKIKGECGSATFLSLEKRGSIPSPAKQIIGQLKILFPRKQITCHLFFGVTSNHYTFGIHRDRMHVLYLQVCGKVNWEIHTPKSTGAISDNLLRERSEKIDSKILNPGMMVWNPKGTFHHSVPLGTRIGFSFGVEGL